VAQKTVLINISASPRMFLSAYDTYHDVHTNITAANTTRSKHCEAAKSLIADYDNYDRVARLRSRSITRGKTEEFKMMERMEGCGNSQASNTV